MLEDVFQMTHLALFESNAILVELLEDNHGKMKFFDNGNGRLEVVETVHLCIVVMLL